MAVEFSAPGRRRGITIRANRPDGPGGTVDGPGRSTAVREDRDNDPKNADSDGPDGEDGDLHVNSGETFDRLGWLLARADEIVAAQGGSLQKAHDQAVGELAARGQEGGQP